MLSETAYACGIAIERASDAAMRQPVHIPPCLACAHALDKLVPLHLADFFEDITHDAAFKRIRHLAVVFGEIRIAELNAEVLRCLHYLVAAHLLARDTFPLAADDHIYLAPLRTCEQLVNHRALDIAYPAFRLSEDERIGYSGPSHCRDELLALKHLL